MRSAEVVVEVPIERWVIMVNILCFIRVKKYWFGDWILSIVICCLRSVDNAPP